jgi:hypothetical protein
VTARPTGPVVAIEGFYGPPLAHGARLDLLRWLPSAGFTAYAYGPKDDRFLRDEWRTDHPAAELAALAETLAVARESGIALSVGLSPGLDWRGDEDEPALVAKLRGLYDLGVRDLGVYWDDTPPGGEELGRTHGRAVAAAVAGLPDDVTWMTVGVDYATDRVTAYLRGFAEELPELVSIAWTGPAITSPEVPAAVARRLAKELDRPLLLADNWPVNDLGMSGVLHLGPAPYREPALRDAVAGVGFNFMSRPLASRPGLEAAARHWLHPAEDREVAWREVVAHHPGLEPLARACRSWVDHPGPDPELLSWVEPAMHGDTRLLDYFDAGCREGLPPDWQEELEPWLTAWETEAFVAMVAIQLVQGQHQEGTVALGIGDVWGALHRAEQQVFGIRFAVYGVTYRAGDRLLPDPGTVVHGDNLVDRLLHRVIARLAEQHGDR